MSVSVDINMVTVHVIFGQNVAIFNEKTLGSDYIGYICYEIMFLVRIIGIC